MRHGRADSTSATCVFSRHDHTVPVEQLDREVQRRIAEGQDEWTAFQGACKALGGKVVEAGPETGCQR